MESPVSGASSAGDGSEVPKKFSAVCAGCGKQLVLHDDADVPDDFSASFRGSIAAPLSTELPARQEGSRAHASARLEEILELAAAQTETDQPSCSSCTKAVEEEIKKRVEVAEKERGTYETRHREIEELVRLQGGNSEVSRLEKEVQALDREEEELQAALADLDQSTDGVLLELEALEQEEDRLRHDQEAYWDRIAEFQLSHDESEEEVAAARHAVQTARADLHRLNQTNVLNEMFHISSVGAFGTINEFRLGRLMPDHPVEWDEINAALGQACLLLDALISRCRMHIPTYELQPKGSYSSIRAGGEVFKLFYDTTAKRGRSNETQFDRAMVAFLACLQEVARSLMKDERTARSPLPFKIDGEKVGNFSVRLFVNNTDEKWTKALKYMLCDLKWTIAVAERGERQ